MIQNHVHLKVKLEIQLRQQYKSPRQPSYVRDKNVQICHRGRFTDFSVMQDEFLTVQYNCPRPVCLQRCHLLYGILMSVMFSKLITYCVPLIPIHTRILMCMQIQTNVHPLSKTTRSSTFGTHNGMWWCQREVLVFRAVKYTEQRGGHGVGRCCTVPHYSRMVQGPHQSDVSYIRLPRIGTPKAHISGHIVGPLFCGGL